MHTPGPWHRPNGSAGIYAGETKVGIISVTHRGGAEDSANGDLFAAAPEMLLALEDIIELAEEGQRNRESDMKDFVEGAHDAFYEGANALQTALAAIAKAKGEA